MAHSSKQSQRGEGGKGERILVANGEAPKSTSEAQNEQAWWSGTGDTDPHESAAFHHDSAALHHRSAVEHQRGGRPDAAQRHFDAALRHADEAQRHHDRAQKAAVAQRPAVPSDDEDDADDRADDEPRTAVPVTEETSEPTPPSSKAKNGAAEGRPARKPN